MQKQTNFVVSVVYQQPVNNNNEIELVARPFVFSFETEEEAMAEYEKLKTEGYISSDTFFGRNSHRIVAVEFVNLELYKEGTNARESEHSQSVGELSGDSGSTTEQQVNDLDASNTGADN